MFLQNVDHFLMVRQATVDAEARCAQMALSDATAGAAIHTWSAARVTEIMGYVKAWICGWWA
jgi:hypothetical protein